ncbi:MAG: conjugal transfer protein TrbI [Desulfobulbaceae bacterium]|nr:conjugal transfer protein TrbI [Desulfobulbaceae bacterium]
MESSPNELRPPQPSRQGLSKRPMYIALGVILALVFSLFYAIEQADKRNARRAAEDKKPQIDERALVQGQGQGIILPPPPSSGALVEGTAAQEERKEPLVVVMRETEPDQDAEALRKRKEQQYIAALSSPMVTKQGAGTASDGSAASTTAGTGSRQDAAMLPGQPSQNYDPAADIDKEGFFTRADTATGERGWLLRYTREDGRLLEIKTGTVIPAVMVSGINSDLPGVMIAQVSQNVWNTANGKYLLIPQGSKLYGVYDSRVVYGQERVLIAWNRVIFPDGSSVTLGAMPGADMSGYAGFHDKVNNHYMRIFGSAFFMSAILGTTAYTLDKVDDNGNNSDNPSFQDEMITALAQQMGSAAMQLLQRNLNIKPTLEIRPGYQFNVITTKDVAFSEPYTPHDYE